MFCRQIVDHNMGDLVILRKLIDAIYKKLDERKDTITTAIYDRLPKEALKVHAVNADTLLWQVSYGVVLKLILYSVLERQLRLPSLKGISTSELVNFLREAYKQTGIQALKDSWIDYGFEILKSHELESLVQEAVQFIEVQAKGDTLGRIYEEIIPQEERRRLGEFYTPRPIAEFMVRWAISSPGSSMLDPGVGSGTFLIEALYRLETLGIARTQAVSQLYGIDINPLAVLMTTINILQRAPGSRPRVFMADFFDVSPLTARILYIDKIEFDAVVCNPPYTRHHELPRAYKERIARLVESESGLRISRLSSLYLHFFIHSFSFLKEGGRAAFITPSEWMESEYGKALREFLLKKASIDAIILFNEDSMAFPGVLTRACITLVTKEKGTGKALLLKLKSWPLAETLLEVIRERKEGGYRWGYAKLVDTEILKASHRWTPLFETAPEISLPGLLTKLGALAKVSRGIATGANEFFTLSENEVRRHNIEHEYLKPVVASARQLTKYLKGYIFRESDWDYMRARGEKIYLLWCFKRKDELQGTNVLKYIERGEKKGYDNRYLTRHRAVWYQVERRSPPDAFLTYMFRKGIRVTLNEFRALALNTLHCVYFKEDVREDAIKVKAILAYLNSDLAFKLASRSLRIYGGGMYKLEPRDAEAIPTLDPSRLKETQLEMLASLFDELDQAARENRKEESKVKEIINAELRRILGL